MKTRYTTATTVRDTDGLLIKLLPTRLTSHKGVNSLKYSEVRRAFADKDNRVFVNTNLYTYIYSIPRDFGRVEKTFFMEAKERALFKQGPVFAIGCHWFTLKQFNRILRAAGVRTTKSQTLKHFKKAI